MISVTSSGDYPNTRKYIKDILSNHYFDGLAEYGRMGVAALESNTPVDTGLAAASWRYRIVADAEGPGIQWYSTDIEGGQNVVIMIQYGHATGTGGYVAGRDFINPTMQPLFDYIAQDVERRFHE